MITSVTNDTVKYVEKLKKKASFRREEGAFVVEGIRMIREVPEQRRRMLFLTEAAMERYPELEGWCSRTELVSEQVLRKLSDTETPQGMLAVVTMAVDGVRKPSEADKAPLYLVLDGVQDPGNVGTIIRTAEAVGASGVLLSRTSADPYSPKVVRSTMGTIFRVPIYIEEDLPAALRKLKQQGVAVFGTHLSGTDFYQADLTGPLAFLIGNEGNGLTPEVAAEAEHLLRIPMEGSVESLNAAVSCSVVAYEAYRQRRA